MLNEEEISGLHEVELRDAKGKPEAVAVEIKYRHIHVLPPICKQKRYPRSTSRCCTPRSVRNQSIGQESTGS
ncbi:hypothetical protein [Mesorhizobium sp. M0678]|uniref:hypothetical protein n=1 Tax=Mesorhizobium sp. M0678 TaxID=2956985 RepID=UPI003334EFEA